MLRACFDENNDIKYVDDNRIEAESSGYRLIMQALKDRPIEGNEKLKTVIENIKKIVDERSGNNVEKK